jgi:hypothetical protein
MGTALFTYRKFKTVPCKTREIAVRSGEPYGLKDTEPSKVRVWRLLNLCESMFSSPNSNDPIV